jgi:thiaminase
MALVYSLLSSLAVGVALVNIRKTIHDKFMQKCFEGRLKKQDIEHYLFGLVSATLHVAH